MKSFRHTSPFRDEIILAHLTISIDENPVEGEPSIRPVVVRHEDHVDRGTVGRELRRESVAAVLAHQ